MTCINYHAYSHRAHDNDTLFLISFIRIGFSLVYTHIFAYCGTIMSTLYLAGRSYQTMIWYEKKLGKCKYACYQWMGGCGCGWRCGCIPYVVLAALPAGWKRLITYVY